MDNPMNWLPALLATLFLAIYITLWISWEIQQKIEEELASIHSIGVLQETLRRREKFIDPDLEEARQKSYLRVSRLHRINYFLCPLWAFKIQKWLFTQNTYCDPPEA